MPPRRSAARCADSLCTAIEALRGPFRLRVRYNQSVTPRILVPRGVLLGHRTYLAARGKGKTDDVRNFRIDLIHEAETLNESFTLQDGFTINRASDFGRQVCRLQPRKAVAANYPERVYGFPGEFYVYGAGRKGSDGCIAPTTGDLWKKSMEALKRYGRPVLMIVHFGSSRRPEALRDALLLGYAA